MYAAHQGNQAVRTAFSAPPAAFTSDSKPQALWGLAGSASLRDKTLIVTVVNPHATDVRECAISVRGGAIREGKAIVLASSDLRAHNSFDHPDALAPRDLTVGLRPGSLVQNFPPASVTRMQLTLD
jgi:alpha-N-arabinofuranosidase